MSVSVDIVLFGQSIIVHHVYIILIVYICNDSSMNHLKIHGLFGKDNKKKGMPHICTHIYAFTNKRFCK